MLLAPLAPSTRRPSCAAPIVRAARPIRPRATRKHAHNCPWPLRSAGFEVCLLIVSTFALRVSLPRAYSNKYVLWTLFLTAKYRAEIQEAFASGETSTGLLALAVAVAVYGGFRAERKFASLLVKLPSGAILDASRQGS